MQFADLCKVLIDIYVEIYVYEYFDETCKRSCDDLFYEGFIHELTPDLFVQIFTDYIKRIEINDDGVMIVCLSKFYLRDAVN